MKIETILEQLLFSTVRIEAVKPTKTEAGTGFIFLYKGDEGEILFLVTNHHIIENATDGSFFFTLSDGSGPILGKRVDVSIADFQQTWTRHPNSKIDIAIMPIAPILGIMDKQGQAAFFKSITQSRIPTKEQISEFDALEEILFIGYPSGIYDSKNLTPVFRKGITATPLQLDYEGSKSFLIDASVFPGSSGSPVFIYDKGGFSPRGGGINLGGDRFLFIGVIAKSFSRNESGRIEFRPESTGVVPVPITNQMIDLGIVFKSEMVIETIEEFFKSRKKV
jgi:hypothetical protein